MRYESKSLSALRPLSELKQLQRIQVAHGETSWQLDDARSQVAALIVGIGLEKFIAEAAERLSVLTDLPYQEFLKTPEWEEMRDAALERAAHRCQLCKSTEGLQVHHRDYADVPLESLADLTVLCGGCHELFHDHRELRAA